MGLSLLPKDKPKCLAVFSWAFLVLVLIFLPSNMDEFLPYHVISCDYYPNAELHTLREPCNSFYDLNLWGLTLKRAYLYVGSWSSWLYYPLFLLIPHPISHKLLGTIFFLGIISLTARLENHQSNRSWWLLRWALSFPILYQLIFDTGPVRWGLLVLFISPLLIRYIQQQKRIAIKLGIQVFLGVILFLAVEDKPFFIYLLPSLICVCLAYNWTDMQDMVKLLGNTILSIIVSATLISIYLFGTKVGDVSYFEHLRSMGQTENSSWQRAWELFQLNLSYLTNWYLYAHRNWSATGFVHDVNAHLGITLVEFGLFILWKVRHQINLSRLFWLGLGLLCNTVIFVYMQNVWAGHHFIFSYAILYLLYNHCLTYASPKIKHALLLLTTLYAFLIGLQFLFTQPFVEASRERNHIFDYIAQPEIGQNYVIVHNNWGTYYQSALYGDRQQVVIYAEPMQEYEVSRIAEVSRWLDRGILIVCRGEECNAKTLYDKFQGQFNFVPVALPTQDWQVWRSLAVGTSSSGFSETGSKERFSEATGENNSRADCVTHDLSSKRGSLI